VDWANFFSRQYAQARVTQVGSDGQQIGIAVRVQNDGSRNYYALYMDSGNLFFGKVVNGTWTPFQLFTPPLAGDVLKLVADGNQISAYKNGAPLSTFTDNSFPSGSPGLSAYGSVATNTIDDWEGGDLSTKVAVGTDNFNRANANPVGGNWQTITGLSNMQILSNQLTGQASLSSGAIYNSGTFSADQYSQATLNAINNTSGVLVRTSSTSETGYLFYQDQDIKLIIG